MQLVLPPFPLLRRFSGVRIGRKDESVRLSRELSARETVRLSPKRRLMLLCGEGSIWITGGRDTRDRVLRTGERLEIDAGTSVVIEGLRESRIEVASC
jgi:hypothetical protein